jgi:hypothetical protein
VCALCSGISASRLARDLGVFPDSWRDWCVRAMSMSWCDVCGCRVVSLLKHLQMYVQLPPPSTSTSTSTTSTTPRSAADTDARAVFVPLLPPQRAPAARWPHNDPNTGELRRVHLVRVWCMCACFCLYCMYAVVMSANTVDTGCLRAARCERTPTGACSAATLRMVRARECVCVTM